MLLATVGTLPGTVGVRVKVRLPPSGTSDGPAGPIVPPVTLGVTVREMAKLAITVSALAPLVTLQMVSLTTLVQPAQPVKMEPGCAVA